MNVKTTVIIPNYNGEKYLKGCLDSVAASRVPAAVIVVDNGSTDGSRQVAEAYGRGGAGVTVLSFPKNRGFCQAVNAGIRAANSPYVFLLNNDAAIEPDCIGALEAVLDADRSLFSAGAKMLSMEDPGLADCVGDGYSALGWAFAVGKGKKEGRYRRRRRVFSNCAGACLYRREGLLALGLFDELHFAYLEDVDIGWRAYLAGWDNVVEPAARALHAGSASTGSRYNAFKTFYSARNNVYLIYKNMPFWQLAVNLPFLALGFVCKALFFRQRGLGGEYVRGLRAGISLCGSPEGKRRKKMPCKCVFGRRALIQLSLWKNLPASLLR